MEKTEIEYLIIAGTVIFIFLGIFIIILLWNYYKRNDDYRNKLLLLEHKKQQELLQTQLEIQEQTLKTISEEIHDNVGQVLSLAKLNLNTLDTYNEQKLIDTKHLISKAINDLRNLSRSMHGDRISELGLEQSISDELTILKTSGHFATNLKILGNSYKIDSQKAMVLFRIMQEAITNIIKHSKATEITIILDYQIDVFCFSIIDNGIGFDISALPRYQKGIGLTSMQNRSALIGGKFSLHSNGIAKGSTIKIEIEKTNNLWLL